MEEVRLGAGRQHERVPRPGPTVLARHRARPGVHTGDLGQLHVDVRLVGEHPPERVRDVAGGELRRRHLVEQGLELVVVVAVDEGYRDVVALCQFLRTTETGEPSADDDYVVLVFVMRHAPAPVEVALRPSARAGDPRPAARWPWR